MGGSHSGTAEVAVIAARLAELVRELAFASDDDADESVELEFVDIINAYTLALKRDGVQPEEVIVAVREAVESMPVAGAIDRRWLVELADASVHHSIRRYFGGAGLAPRSTPHEE